MMSSFERKLRRNRPGDTIEFVSGVMINCDALSRLVAPSDKTEHPSLFVYNGHEYTGLNAIPDIHSIDYLVISRRGRPSFMIIIIPRQFGILVTGNSPDAKEAMSKIKKDVIVGKSGILWRVRKLTFLDWSIIVANLAVGLGIMTGFKWINLFNLAAAIMYFLYQVFGFPANTYIQDNPRNPLLPPKVGVSPFYKELYPMVRRAVRIARVRELLFLGLGAIAVVISGILNEVGVKLLGYFFP